MIDRACAYDLTTPIVYCTNVRDPSLIDHPQAFPALREIIVLIFN